MIFKILGFFRQMSAVLLLMFSSDSAPTDGRLSEAEWQSYNEMDHQVRF
jgi:hypothetical protein